MDTRILYFLILSGIFSISGHDIYQNKAFLQTVVIDAGHGGKDSGCNGATNSKEKYVTLAIALKLGKKIKATYPNIKVVYTRQKDVFVELHKRAKIANEHKADLFISIHCNAAIRYKQKASGSETYALGLHRADDNLEVMKRENDVILLEEDYEDNYDYNPYSPENHIINALIQNKHLEQSLNFASKIERQFVLAKRKSRGVKQAGFAVLRGAAMPAVLIESGFLTHKGEEKFLVSKEGQDVMATAIFKAFEAYKKEVDIDTKKDVVLKVPEINLNYKKDVEYKVQLAVVANLENPNIEDLIKAKKVDVIAYKNLKKIMSKGFQTYEAAIKAKQLWVELGFTDAFIVVFKDGIQVSIAELNSAKK